MNKKRIAEAVILVIAVVAVVVFLSGRNLSDVIESDKEIGGPYVITAIEKTGNIGDEGLIIKEIDRENSYYDDLVEQLKKTTIKYRKTEAGTEYERTIYTLFLEPEEKEDTGKSLHISVSDENVVHNNRSGKTYSTDNEKLFHIIGKAFDEADE